MYALAAGIDADCECDRIKHLDNDIVFIHLQFDVLSIIFRHFKDALINFIHGITAESAAFGQIFIKQIVMLELFVELLGAEYIRKRAVRLIVGYAVVIGQSCELMVGQMSGHPASDSERVNPIIADRLAVVTDCAVIKEIDVKADFMPDKRRAMDESKERTEHISNVGSLSQHVVGYAGERGDTQIDQASWICQTAEGIHDFSVPDFDGGKFDDFTIGRGQTCCFEIDYDVIIKSGKQTLPFAVPANFTDV